MPSEYWFSQSLALMPPNRILISHSDNKNVAELCPAGCGSSPMNLSGAISFLQGDPFVGAGFQEIEGEGSAVEHFVVEFADVEFGTQFFLGAVAEFTDL